MERLGYIPDNDLIRCRRIGIALRHRMERVIAQPRDDLLLSIRRFICYRETAAAVLKNHIAISQIKGGGVGADAPVHLDLAAAGSNGQAGFLDRRSAIQTRNCHRDAGVLPRNHLDVHITLSDLLHMKDIVTCRFSRAQRDAVPGHLNLRHRYISCDTAIPENKACFT